MKYTQRNSKLGRQDASKPRESSILNRSIFPILTDLRSAIRRSFHASWRPSFELRWVYCSLFLIVSKCLLAEGIFTSQQSLEAFKADIEIFNDDYTCIQDAIDATVHLGM